MKVLDLSPPTAEKVHYLQKFALFTQKRLCITHFFQVSNHHQTTALSSKKGYPQTSVYPT